MITTTSKLRKIIKRIILESVGRNLQSVSNDPISYDIAYGFDIDTYYDTNTNKWICTIEKDGEEVEAESRERGDIEREGSEEGCKRRRR